MSSPIKFPRFRITTLLLLIALFAMGLGWWQDWHRRQRDLYLHVLRPSIYKNADRLPPESVSVTRIVAFQEFHAEQTINRRVKGILTVSPVGKYHLKVDGNFKSSFNYDGPLELEKLTQPTGFGFASLLDLYVFAVSDSQDPTALIKQQAESEQVAAEKESTKAPLR